MRRSRTCRHSEPFRTKTRDLIKQRLQEMNERMGQCQEELQEFQNEFELLAGDKSEKFRELKGREAHMDLFLVGSI